MDWTGLDAFFRSNWIELDCINYRTDSDWTGLFQTNPFHTLTVSALSLTSEPLVVERRIKQHLQALNQVSLLSTFFA